MGAFSAHRAALGQPHSALLVTSKGLLVAPITDYYIVIAGNQPVVVDQLAFTTNPAKNWLASSSWVR